jgi:hypothetical protein
MPVVAPNQGALMIELPKYPGVKVQLSGEESNALAIMGAVSAALRQAGVPDEEITLFLEESTSGNFEDLLVTVMKWVDVK